MLVVRSKGKHSDSSRDILIFYHCCLQYLSLNYEIVLLKIYSRRWDGLKEHNKFYHVVSAVIVVAAVVAVDAVNAVAVVVVPLSSHQ